MTKTVKRELAKVTIADLSNFDESELTYKIPKYNKFKYEVNKCYLIQLDDFIVHPYDMTLANNYNNGSVPNYNYYYVEVMRVVGKMIRVSGIAYDINRNENINSIWEGWLPVDNIHVIERR